MKDDLDIASQAAAKKSGLTKSGKLSTAGAGDDDVDMADGKEEVKAEGEGEEEGEGEGEEEKKIVVDPVTAAVNGTNHFPCPRGIKQ